MKRLFALLLAAMLVIGDVVPAFAETLPETTEQFTVAQEISVSGETGEETMEQAEEETGAELFAAAADGMDPEGCIPEYDPGLEPDPDPEPEMYSEQDHSEDPDSRYRMHITGGAMGYFTVNDGEEELWEVEIRSSSNYVNPVRNILYVGSDAVTAHPDQSGDGDYVFTGWEIPDELPEREINYIHASFEEGIRAEFEVSGNAEGIFTVKVDPDNLLDNDALIIGTMVEARGESLWFSNQVFDGILARIEGKSCEYCFKEWSGIPEDGILTENTTITAVFESTDNPVVSVSATEGGAVSPAEDFKVPMYTKLWADGNQLTYQGQGKDSGFSGTVTAEAEAGYQFSGWYLNDGSFRKKLRSDGNYENGFYVVNCDTAFVAKFSKLPDTYRIHAYCKDGGGIVTPTYVMANYGDTFREDGNKLYVGDEVFEATPYYGYKFKRWSGVPQNVTKEDTVWAEFTPIYKSVEINAGEGGRIRTSATGTVIESKKLSGKLQLGTYVSYGEDWLKIGSNYYYPSPDAGYEFDHWTFEPALDEKSRIAGDTVIGAVFRVSRPIVTLSCWKGGSTDPAGPIEVAYNTPIRADGNKLHIGDETVITAVPEENYVFTGWLNIPKSGLITDELTVTAKFVKDGFRVVVGGNSNTELFVNSVRQTYSSYELEEVRWGTEVRTEGNVVCIGDQEFRAEAKIGFEITGWDGSPADGIVTGESYIVPKTSVKKWDLNAEAGEGGKLETSSGYTYSKYAGKMANGGKLSALGRLLLYDVYNSKTGRVYEDSLEAVANTGYRFVRWEGLPDTGKADREVNAKAVFEPITSTVTIKRWAGAGGTVDRLKVDNVPYGASLRCSGNVLYVGDQMVTAKPFDGYKVDWNITSEYVYEDCEVIVEFDPITYSATFSHTEGGSTSRDTLSGIGHGERVYVDGNRITIGNETVTAIADEGYIFREWTDLPESGKVTDNLSVKAVFEISRYDVAITAQNGGTVDVSCIKDVEYGTEIKADGNKLTIGSTVVTATADERFGFTGWEGIPENGKVTDKLSITAAFRRTSCLVHFVIEEGGSVTGYSTDDMVVPVGTILYCYDGALRMYYNGTPKVESRSWRAVPEEGRYASWKGIPEDKTVTEDLTVTAAFEKWNFRVLIETDYDTGKRQYKGKVNGDLNVSLTAEYGTQVTLDKETLKVGDTVITATANAGYVFDRWEGVPEGGTVKSELRIKAVFVNEYTTVQVTAGDGGTVDTAETLKIDLGTKVTGETHSVTTGYLNFGDLRVTARSKTGYHFDHWEGIPENGIVEDPLTIKAVFTVQKYGVRVKAGEGGTIDPSGKVTVNHFDKIRVDGNRIYFGDVCVTAKASDGYKFAGWSNLPANMVVDGTDLSSITANFEKANARITKQPVNQTVYSSATAKFSVEADGYGTLSYQWEYKNYNSTNWRTMTGTAGKNASIEVSAYSYSDCSFRCTVTDSRGTKAVSNEVKLTAVSVARISANPSSATVYEGDSVSFSAKASGYNLSYQWQELAGGGSWSDIAGATALTYSFKAVYAQSGHGFRLKVTDGLGTVLYSNEAGLTVYRKPVITAQPADSIVASGATATFTVAAAYGYGSLTYQWQRKLPSSSSWSGISGSSAKKASYQITVNASNDAYQYRCVVTDSKGTSVTSNAAKLTVYTKPSISSNPGSVSVYAGDRVELKVTAGGTVKGYQWQQLPVNGSWSDIAGATGTAYSFTADMNKNNYQYRCKAIGMYGSEAVSSAAKVTVVKKLTITAQPKSVTAERRNTVIFSVGAEGGNGTLSYQWQEKRTSSSSWKTISGTAAKKASYQQTAGISSNGYSYRCVVTDSKGAAVTSNAAQLTILEVLSINSHPQDASVGSGMTASFTVSASGAEIYQWQTSTDGANWANCSQSTAGTKTLQVTADSSTFGRSYRCVVSNSLGKKLTSNAAKLSKKETLKIVSQPVNTTVKTNEYATFTVGATGDGLTYKWYYYNSENGWISVGSTSAKLSIKATRSMNKGRFRCYVKDKYGNYQYTNTVYLYVTK